MRMMTVWLTAALLAALTFTGVGESQPPGQKKKGPPDGFGKKDGPGFKKGKKGKGKGAPLTTDGVADYLLAFDKAKTGKVTRDQLPERMQHLVDQGDTNEDGALDREEILALAAKLSQDRSLAGFGRGPKGFGGKGPKGGKGGKKGKGFPPKSDAPS